MPRNHFFHFYSLQTHKKRTKRQQIFNTSTHLAGSNGMYRRNLNVLYGISPFLLAQRLWSFFWCFKQKKKTTTTKTLRTRSVHCNRFSRSKNLDFFLILFLCVHGAAQPVAAAAAAADSSTAGPRGSKGTALKVTKRFFGRESKLLVWEVLYQLSISTSHTSLCLSSSLPREPVPRPPPSRLLGRGYFGGLCLFFV